MLPDPDYGPAFASEYVIHLYVLDDIPLDLRDPVATVALYAVLPVFPVVTMPEVPIAEDCDLVFLHGDVRMSVNGAAVLPESEAAMPESTGESSFD